MAKAPQAHDPSSAGTSSTGCADVDFNSCRAQNHPSATAVLPIRRSYRRAIGEVGPQAHGVMKLSGKADHRIGCRHPMTVRPHAEQPATRSDRNRKNKKMSASYVACQGVRQICGNLGGGRGQDALAPRHIPQPETVDLTNLTYTHLSGYAVFGLAPVSHTRSLALRAPPPTPAGRQPGPWSAPAARSSEMRRRAQPGRAGRALAWRRSVVRGSGARRS